MKKALANLFRIKTAAQMGFLWTGTTRFVAPTSFKWRSRRWSLTLPPETTLNWIFRDLLLDDEYGLAKLRNTPTTILDIGANVGMFSLWAGINFPGAVIHAYEPNVNLQKFLASNAGQVGARIFNEGVSGTDGRGSFNQNGESMGGQCRAGENGDIAVASLSTAIRRVGGAVDLLKLDCEGAEWSMLEYPEAFAAVRRVRMEYHLLNANHSIERLTEVFQRMGFYRSRLSQNQGFGLAWFDRA
jgi:FkbM family methyltransferase